MFGIDGTLKEVLDRNRGIGPGFDVLRIALAVIIFNGHVSWLTAHTSFGAMPVNHLNMLAHKGWEGWRRPIEVSWVPAFFALSGFLVMGSALRTRATQTFIAFRALRIFPALIVELTLSAFVLGLCLTSLPAARYLHSPMFWSYFGNLVGWVHFEIPGVFLNNNVPRIVNANLWTLPSEFDCYLISALLMLSGVLYNRKVFTVIFCILTVAFIALNTYTDFAVTPTTLEAHTVTYYFFVGMLFYHWRASVPLNWWLFGLAAVACYFLQFGHHTVYLAPIFLTYVVLFVGMFRFPKIPLISSGDYSYGIYLYGFPITQAVIAIFPGISTQRFLVLFLAGGLTFGFAAFSWHAIEKRALAAKKHLPKRLFPTAEKASVALPSERLAAVGLGSP